MEGGDISFTDLIQRYGGDIAVVTVLREFRCSKVVVDTGDGLLRVVRRQYIPNYYVDIEKASELVAPAAIEHGK